ncbi:MAG TPA: hypothetical protein VGM56_25005, partial [Byssovorax sp.]
CVAAPALRVGDAAASAITFVGATVVVIAPLALAAPARPSTRAAVGAATLAIACVVVAALARPDVRVAAALVDFGLVALAAAAGGGIGRRIQHPGHLAPACAVAAAADLASVLSPAGPTRAIASSERALSLLAVGFAVPGTHAVAPSIGLGDALFIALALGCASAHGLGVARLAIACAVGLAAAGALSAATAAPIPALVLVAAAVVAASPRARAVRREDRTTTQVAFAIAAGVALAVVLQRALAD